MRQEEALSMILVKWRELPQSERQTKNQLAGFAMRMAHDPTYEFRCSGDRYQNILGYLMRCSPGLS